MRLTDLPSKIPMLDALGIEDPNIPIDEVMAIGAGLSAAAAVMWAMKKRTPKHLLEAYAKYKLAQADKKREALDSLMPLLKEWGARDIGAGTADIIGALEGGSILPEKFLDFSDSGSADSFMLKLLQDEYVDL